MLDVKKKLSSLIPNSARAQLQNVLTVEWDTHKTVLMEVPGAHDRSSEMEMSGIERGNRETSNYGRLVDDDEETEGLFNRSNIDSSRSDWNPSSSSRSRSGSSGSKIKKRPPPLAPRPDEYQQANDNPFDETSPSYLASLSSGPTYSYPEMGGSGSRQLHGARAAGTPERNQRSSTHWATFEDEQLYRSHGAAGDRQKQQAQVGNPWGAGGEWGHVEAPSPSSSRGTRESDLHEAENPFR